jgi:hypothetical protein
MTKSDIQNPAFTDEDKARETLEAIRWPDGPYCPHCGNADQKKGIEYNFHREPELQWRAGQEGGGEGGGHVRDRRAHLWAR